MNSYIHWPLQDIETLADDLNGFVARHPDTFGDERISREIAVLERWRECYRDNLVDATAFSHTSMLLLANLHDRLKQALEDVQRLKTSTPGDAAPRYRELVTLFRRVEQLLDVQAV